MANWMRRHLPTTRRVVYVTMGVVLIAEGATALLRGSVSYPNYWGGKVFPPLAIVLGLASVGFAVADGRPKIIAVETTVAFGFILVAAAAVTGSPWLLVVGLAGHGLKDLWQHRTHFVRGTRWWPPFCASVDFVAAAIIAGEIAAGMDFG